MAFTKVLLLLMSVWMVSAQRPSFAGTQPIGFPAIEKAPSNDSLGNRFGSDGDALELPIEAKGDRDLVERISKMPIDKQPFWYVNWKAYEANRKNPQTYQPRPNVFNPISPNVAPSGNPANSNSDLTSKFGSPNNDVNTNLNNDKTKFNNDNTQLPHDNTYYNDNKYNDNSQKNRNYRKNSGRYGH